MTTSRNQILERLKMAKVRSQVQKDIAFHPWGSDEKKTNEQKMTRFCQALSASHAEIKSIHSEQLSQTLNQLSGEKGWKKAVIGTQGKWHHAFQQSLTGIDVKKFSQEIEGWKTELFTDIDVGITHVLAGIADTGTLVLWPTPQEPRTLSLVPPCHVAVIHASTLHHHFLEVMAVQNWADNMPTNALLISGPSKTADIQQTLAYGAHGPSELIVVILEDQ
ncbi:LUD domain-containing protein [Vibrio sp. S17_S38]|uniref:LutC/YkgG family protein n=1 Tax=Vibrio sp. S17_S38 TaxID=2720229 RepID=UPI0016805355|nr:lactate utilization protein [Vibrio sp. S17_S38]MBD1573232.1 LUD domain-containing protein [Vibrio sp. S17_S38]